MIGKTNSLSGGDIKGETLKVSLRTNQSSHSDLNGVAFTLEYADSSERYVWKGSDIIIKLPPYLSYTITPEDVDGYKTPSVYSSTSIGGFQKTATLEYKCTIVTVKMDDNQPNYNDISSVTANVSSSGMTTKKVSNGGTAKVPTGNACTITWGSVGGYKTPDSQTFTASGTSVTKTGTYQTEILTVNTVTPSGFSGGYTITVSGFGSHTIASNIYKIPFGTSYTVSASTIDGYIVTPAQSFTANSVSRTVTMEYNIKPATDLSMYDIFGSPINQTTANCYVVKETGEYRFPIVFGNAIKNGSTNSEAYTKVGTSNKADFVDYNNKVITSPYIESVSGSASGVELSMADTNGVFSDFSIIDGTPCRYVKFKVNSVPTTGANGVISVLNSGGTVMWSWHIWVWTDDLTPVTITNNAGINYNILPVNLASKKDASGKMVSWYYQWGRHIPMLPAKAYNSTTNATNYGVKTFTISTGNASTYCDGIKNPHIFYINKTSGNSWFGAKKASNLWAAQTQSTGQGYYETVKTVYDPCPVGFKIPDSDTFTGFSTSNVVGSFDNGYYFKRNSNDTVGVYFPALGYRYNETGKIQHVCNYGWAWSASFYSSNNSAYMLYYGNNYVRTDTSYNVAYGLSVRPSQEYF